MPIKIVEKFEFAAIFASRKNSLTAEEKFCRIIIQMKEDLIIKYERGFKSELKSVQIARQFHLKNFTYVKINARFEFAAIFASSLKKEQFDS